MVRRPGNLLSKEVRVLALRVLCEYCGSPPGERCTRSSDGSYTPAHTVRRRRGVAPPITTKEPSNGPLLPKVVVRMDHRETVLQFAKRVNLEVRGRISEEATELIFMELVESESLMAAWQRASRVVTLLPPVKPMVSVG